MIITNFPVRVKQTILQEMMQSVMRREYCPNTGLQKLHTNAVIADTGI